MKGSGKIVFKWTPTQQQDFEQLKNKICTAPVLVLPDLHHPFEIETDASDYALDVVITQLGHPITFHSKNFKDTIITYSTYEKELYAIVKDLKQWRHYILGKETIITLTINLYSSLHPCRNYRQLDISSGLITCNSSGW